MNDFLLGILIGFGAGLISVLIFLAVIYLNEVKKSINGIL